MKVIKFDNLIDSKTGKAIEIKVDDDFDTALMEELGRRAKESAKRMKNAFST